MTYPGDDADEEYTPDLSVDDGPEERAELRVDSAPDAIRRIRRAIVAGNLPGTYVQDGDVVHVESVSGTPGAAIDADAPLPVRATVLTPAHLAALLARHLDVRRASQNDGWQEWTPPVQVLSASLAGGEWPGLATLVGIVGTPVIRRDGSLFQDAGHDPATGLYLAPRVPIPDVPVPPNEKIVKAAREFILEKLLADFEWAADADRANYLGLLVSPIARRYLGGLTPLGIISATMPGSGKSILAGLAGQLAGQRTLPWADDDHELRKAISGSFTTEAGVVVFDNLEEGAKVASPILANLLTNPVWSDRILGSTKVGSWPNDRLYMVTGNNLQVGGDIRRRGVLVRLSPKAPDPEGRQGFAIPNLDEWIMKPAHQARVLWYLLVLLLDWIAAGAERDKTAPAMGQFTPWAHGIGGFLKHHGVPGFLQNLDVLRESDEDDQKWAAFLAMWRRRFSGRQVRAREVFEDAAVDELLGHVNDPWDGMFITSPRGARPRSHVMLGQWLTGHDGRFHGELRLRSVQDTHAKVRLWWVEEYAPSSDSAKQPTQTPAPPQTVPVPAHMSADLDLATPATAGVVPPQVS